MSDSCSNDDESTSGPDAAPSTDDATPAESGPDLSGSATPAGYVLPTLDTLAAGAGDVAVRITSGETVTYIRADPADPDGNFDVLTIGYVPDDTQSGCRTRNVRRCAPGEYVVDAVASAPADNIAVVSTDETPFVYGDV